MMRNQNKKALKNNADRLYFEKTFTTVETDQLYEDLLIRVSFGTIVDIMINGKCSLRFYSMHIANINYKIQ